MRRNVIAGSLIVGLGLLSPGTASGSTHGTGSVPRLTAVTFTMSGYANLARDVPRFQLGQVYLEGWGTLTKGGSISGLTKTRNAYLFYPEATMQTEIVGWSYSSTPHGTRQELVLDLKVVASNDPVDCKVGSMGKMTLVDDNRRMKNGQTRDSITQIYLTSECPSFVQGVTNKNASHLQPTKGGPGGGQWADVSIAAQ